MGLAGLGDLPGGLGRDLLGLRLKGDCTAGHVGRFFLRVDGAGAADHDGGGLDVIHRVECGVDLVVKAAGPALRRDLLHNGGGSKNFLGDGINGGDVHRTRGGGFNGGRYGGRRPPGRFLWGCPNDEILLKIPGNFF